MRTIGKRFHGKPGTDYRTECAECRAPELRSKLYRLRDGRLVHRRCFRGKTAQELSEANAERARASHREYPPQDGPGFQSRGREELAAPPGPAFPIVGWTWAKAGSGEPVAGTLRPRKAAPSVFYQVDGDAEFLTAQVFPFDVGDPAVNGRRFYTASKLGPTMAAVGGWNSLGGPDIVEGPNGSGWFVVFLYGETGFSMLNEVAWAWVDTTGAIVDKEGDVTATRTATGRYTLTLTGSTYRVGQATQHTTTADPQSGAETLYVWGGRTSETEMKVAAINNATVTNTDADFIARFYA